MSIRKLGSILRRIQESKPKLLWRLRRMIESQFSILKQIYRVYFTESSSCNKLLKQLLLHPFFYYSFPCLHFRVWY
jgi:hypothetical protein